MKSALSLFAASVILLSASPVQAQESPETQLEFIQRLRARNYNDLAMELIETLGKAGFPRPAVLQLERAKTMLALAREKEPENRAQLFGAARAVLEDFVAKNSGGPEAARGRLEIARIAAYQGQSLLTRTVRDDDVAVAAKAEQQFIQAGQELEAAAKALADLVANYKNPDADKEKAIKAELAAELLQARVDRASNFIDQAQTYIDISKDAINRKRAEVVNEAKLAFKAIAEDGGPAGLMASAWLVKVYQEGQDTAEAEKNRLRVMNATSADAVPAQRWARLFYMQGLAKSPTAKSMKIVEDEGKKWLAANPNHHKSREGYMVRYELAQAIMQMTPILKKETKLSDKQVQNRYDEAQKHFATIADSDSLLAEKARSQNVALSVQKMGEKTAIADLKNFEDCFLKAQVEMFNMKNAAGDAKDPDKQDAARKKHLKEVIKALTRGIMLADARTNAHNLDEARFFLATGHLMSGDHYRAAVAGEALGRAKPPTKRSAQAAGYAVEAYSSILQRDGDEINRRRLKELTDYILSPEMQKAWANEPVTSVARYQLAMLHDKDNEFNAAVAQLEKLPPDFAGYIYAQGQLVFIALKGKEKAATEDEKKSFADAARKAILRTPPIGNDADSNTAVMYFFSQLEMPRFLYADAVGHLNKKDLVKAQQAYAETGKFIADLRAKLDKSTIKITGENRARIASSLDGMAKYARLGLTELDYRKGNYDVVVKNTTADVAFVDKEGKDQKVKRKADYEKERKEYDARLKEAKEKNEKFDEPPTKYDPSDAIILPDFSVTGDLLGLALRANVQKGNVAQAKQILGYLDRLAGQEGGIGGSSGVLQSLIGDLNLQVRELKKTNDTAKLKTTVNNFSAFIDDLATKGDKALALKDLMFLGTCYSSLEQYAKAANLYAKISEPKSLAQDKLEEKDERDVSTYWYVQIQYAKALRMSAQNKEELGKSKKVLDVLQKHKHARLQIEAEKEQIHILEDSAKFGNPLWGLALKGWTGIMSNPAVKAKLDDPKVKDIYFESYYGYTYCMYKYSQTEKVIAAQKEKQYLRAASNNILKLERSMNQEGWQIVGHRFRDLIEAEPKLRQDYDELKKTAK